MKKGTDRIGVARDREASRAALTQSTRLSLSGCFSLPPPKG